MNDEVIKLDPEKLLAHKGFQMCVRLVETQDTINELNKAYDELLKILKKDDRDMFLEFQCMSLQDRRCLVELNEMAEGEVKDE